MTLPDRFIDHNVPAAQIIEAGLGAKDIVATALGALGKEGALGKDASKPTLVAPVR
jgi:1-deoxy-D-xylulose-5-phosphate synthase